jgi:hypothetical protein
MKRLLFLVTVLALGLILSTASLAGEFFFDTVMDKTISTSTPAKVVNLQGYKEFSLLSRFEGPANQSVIFEINNNNLLIIRESVQLNAQGWANFKKVYPVYAPNVGVVVYNPPPNLKAKILIYAGH